jgi:hypothetical protein
MYDPKSSGVAAAQLKAQRLVLNFSVVGHATPASKSSSVDDPSVLFLQLEGTGQDNITVAAGALDTAETVPSFTTSASDASGILNCLVKISEPIKKVLSATCTRQSTTVAEADDAFIVSLGDADGLTANGDKIILTIDSNGAFTSGTHNLCLVVNYSVDEQA